MSTFMCQKSFHPANKANQKVRWIAEQREVSQKKEAERRQKELELDRKSLKLGGKSSEVSFLYKAPPGYTTETKKEDIGPKPDEPEFLKNAPTEGTYTKQMQVTHNPLGHVTINIRCIRCGVVGHRTGSRDCKLRNELSDYDVKTKVEEDPMHLMSQVQGQTSNQGNLVLKEELSQIHHGPAHLKGVYDFVGSDDEGELDAQSLVSSLSDKQKRRLLRFMKKRKKKEKKEEKKKAKKRRKEERDEREQWVEA